MKKDLLALLLLVTFGLTSLSAQSILQGINYQGVARDAEGSLLTNSKLSFRISMVSKDGVDLFQNHYSESHAVTTDNLGLFHFVIGSGEIESGSMENIPWASESIFLQTEMALNASAKFELLDRTELQAVPYAYYAVTANQLVTDNQIDLPSEKNQSIYWTTGGNTGTRPPTQFIGTLDNQPLVFKTNNMVSMTLTTNGRLELANRTPAGLSSLKSSYPLVVEGLFNTQGIWIEINGSRSSANNFLTFVDDSGIKGRVEGQTLSELLNSDTYVYTSEVFALNGVALGLNIVALGIEIGDAWAKFWTWPKGIPLTAKAVTYGVQVASLLVASIKWAERVQKNVGVAYSSGNGDYAEWLQRMPGERDFQFGEIVGVNGGKISLNTQNSSQLMVVSKDPIVLGNMPAEPEKAQFEKVAFMGQVFVKVIGDVKVGDYILPSGNHDGCGVAVSPKQMKAGDYNRIVGIAWEDSESELFNYINVAVGINTNDLATKVDELDQRINAIMAQLEGKNGQKLEAQIAQVNVAELQQKPISSFEKMFSDEDFDKYVDQNQFYFRSLFNLAKAKMIKEGYDASTLQQLEPVFADPISVIKKLRRDPKFMTHWHTIDSRIQSTKK